MRERVLRAAGDLLFRLSPEAVGGSVGFGEDAPDWLGPVALGRRAGNGLDALEVATLRDFAGRDGLGAFEGIALGWRGLGHPVATSVRAYREAPVLVFRLEAREPVGGTDDGAFERPALAWPWLRPAERRPRGVPDGTRSFGFQYTEFAFPVMGDADCTGFVFVPHRPAVVVPLGLFAPDGRTLLLAPLDGFHEQIVRVPRQREQASEGVACGWHGDLRRVPAGFATELAVWGAAGPRAALSAWGAHVQARHGAARRGRYGDDLVGKLSYWTDNGGVYYYRTTPGCDYAETLERVLEDLAQRRIPVRALHLDSWFYPHEHPRPVSAEGAPVVPPSGMLRWEPREDVFPEGLDGLAARLGGRPLSFHSRHFSARSPYWQAHPAWRDGDRAHPADPAFFELLAERAARWGAVTYEQDWMVESFLGVRGLREEPGRADAWQRGLDSAAGERGLTLLWCMATPADFMESVRLRHLCAIRASGDYQYLYDNALNWVWFLHTSALARALGLWPYKDVFLSHDKTPEGFGEPLGEAEALLASLSGGPVGLGDQIGHGRRELLLRTCREDGVLVKPDLPLAALDRCGGEHAYFGRAPLIGETLSRHPAGDWVYVVAMNASHATKQAGERLDFRVALADLGEARPRGPILAYDWRGDRHLRLEPDEGWEESLAYQDFSFRILCPLLQGDATVIGDVSKYASVGDRRVARITSLDGGLRFDVLGVPGTRVDVHGWAAQRPAGASHWSPECSGELASLQWREDGRWIVGVPLDATGIARVTVRLR